MSNDHYSQDNGVIAKEITIALIQKSNLSSDALLDFACKAFDKICKQQIKTEKDTHSS